MMIPDSYLNMYSTLMQKTYLNKKRSVRDPVDRSENNLNMFFALIEITYLKIVAVTERTYYRF